MKRTIAVVLLFSTILTTGFAQKKKSGEEYSAQAKKGVIPAWEKGYLDIHFISTNTGESTFIIMPDGTISADYEDLHMGSHNFDMLTVDVWYVEGCKDLETLYRYNVTERSGEYDCISTVK